jgi:four helix bundle protein
MGDGRWGKASENLGQGRLGMSDRQKVEKFEDLDAWKEARKLVKQIYTLTREPGIRRDFGLNDQIRRAGVSVMSNIAEGFERRHLPEKLQFYSIARASGGEVRSLLYVLEDNHADCAVRATELCLKSAHVGRLLTGLIQSTERRRSHGGTEARSHGVTEDQIAEPVPPSAISHLPSPEMREQDQDQDQDQDQEPRPPRDERPRLGDAVPPSAISHLPR